MNKLPDNFIIFDTEFTSWEGAQARNWSGPNEHKEIIQIGAIKVQNLLETDIFSAFVLPHINPILSDYIAKLTGISQDVLDAKGRDYPSVQTEFFAWCEGLPLYSFGNDGDVLKENSLLNGLDFPWTAEAFSDVREYFESLGVNTKGYMSSTIPRAFNVEPPPHGHDALNDARSILLAIQASLYTA